MLLWGARIGMFIGFGVVGLLALSSGAQLSRRRWRAGLLRLLGAAVGAGLGITAMSALGLAYANSKYLPALGDVAVKARLLGAAIGTQMNWALGGVLSSVGVGLVAAVARRAQRMDAGG